jgi:hypothetical protein
VQKKAHRKERRKFPENMQEPITAKYEAKLLASFCFRFFAKIHLLFTFKTG